MGPGGSGKSALLRALAGVPIEPGWDRGGQWRHRGQDLTAVWQSAAPPRDLAWVAQAPRSRVFYDPARATPPTNWRDPFHANTRTVLLDEPTRGIPGTELYELEAMVGSLRRVGAVVLVTHDQRIARRLADRVVLVCAGRIESDAETDEFFSRPSSPLVERFIQQGNCWPLAEEAPPLPEHFRWIEEGSLAGVGVPGLLRDEEEDLASMAANGITHLVSLTEEPYPRDKLASFGISGRHLAIRDMNVPAVRTAASLCRSIERIIDDGGSVAVHCRAGLGRTGTILAAYLVWRGAGPDDAIQRLRAIRSGYLQVKAQERFIHQFAEAVPPPAREKTG
jgi:atypical dual specificity phosphatase